MSTQEAYLNLDGLVFYNSKIQNVLKEKVDSVAVPTKTSDLTNDSGFITVNDVPEGVSASNTTPKMDGVAKVGTETAFARGDHTHPTDTTRLSTTGDSSSTTVSFNVATSREDLGSGDTLATIIGKTQKVFNDLGTLAFNDTVDRSSLDSSTKASLSKADSALQSYTETDPTVPAWAKTPNKPTYTASEVGAISSLQADTFAKKSDITTVYSYKGSVATVDALPTSNNNVGDVIKVTDTGVSYAWDGTSWDDFGSDLTIRAITNTEIDAIFTTTD